MSTSPFYFHFSLNCLGRTAENILKTDLRRAIRSDETLKKYYFSSEHILLSKKKSHLSKAMQNRLEGVPSNRKTAEALGRWIYYSYQSWKSQVSIDRNRRCEEYRFSKSKSGYILESDGILGRFMKRREFEKRFFEMVPQILKEVIQKEEKAKGLPITNSWRRSFPGRYSDKIIIAGSITLGILLAFAIASDDSGKKNKNHRGYHPAHTWVWFRALDDTSQDFSEFLGRMSCRSVTRKAGGLPVRKNE